MELKNLVDRGHQMTPYLEKKTYAQVMIKHMKRTLKDQKEISSGKKEDQRITSLMSPSN